MTPGARLDGLRIAFFGLATRRAVIDYLKVVLLMQFVLLSVAWTVDLAGTFPGIRADAQAQGRPVYEIVLPYLAYRSADMIVRLLPMACFFGVFLAEIRRRARLETVIFAAGGASPIRMLASVVIFGALAGALQTKLEADWRPRAVEAQVALGHGSYARRFATGWVRGDQWFVSGDTAVRAQVLRDDPPAMRDVLVFVGLRPPALRQVYSAEYAEPGEKPGTWRLTGAALWDIAAGGERNAPLGDITLTLDLIPEQLRYFGVPGFYLRDAPLRAIAGMRNAAVTAADADVAIWRRRTAWALPGMAALLAAALAKSGYSGRQPNYLLLIALALAGYIAVISIKVLWTVGELGGLPGPVATGASILYFLAASAVLIRRQL